MALRVSQHITDFIFSSCRHEGEAKLTSRERTRLGRSHGIYGSFFLFFMQVVNLHRSFKSLRVSIRRGDYFFTLLSCDNLGRPILSTCFYPLFQRVVVWPSCFQAWRPNSPCLRFLGLHHEPSSSLFLDYLHRHRSFCLSSIVVTKLLRRYWF